MKQTNDTPQRILLATDLSARSDRALDRAAQLCQEWQAELLALHVLNPADAPDQALDWLRQASDQDMFEIARRQLRRDLADLEIQATMHTVRHLDPASAIVQLAERSEARLVVSGVARNEALGRFLLGSTVESLAHRLSCPLLVVRHRPRSAYRHIVVACDFSPCARHTLETAAQCFPDRVLQLYHASGESLTDMALRKDAILASALPDEYDAFIATCTLPESTILQPVIERGRVESALSRYVRENDIELVVIGSHGRGGFLKKLLGSTASSLLHWLPCDVLLIPDPGRR